MGNLDAWEYLKGLKTLFVAEEKRERNVKLLEPATVEANRFHVTDEFAFSNGVPPDIRPDIVFFVSRVPVVIVETKRATAAEGIAEAMDDIRYYHRKGPELLVLSQVHAVTHLIRFHYGGHGASRARTSSTGATTPWVPKTSRPSASRLSRLAGSFAC